MKDNLKDFIVVHEDSLSKLRCEALIENFHRQARFQSRSGAHIVEGLEDSGWTEMNLSIVAETSVKSEFERLVRDHFARYNAQVRLPNSISPIGKLSDLKMKQYEVARRDRFQIHFDSLGACSNRYLVFLWFLNDVSVGGETCFPALDLKIKPKAGSLLIFPPYWMFQHSGLPPVSEDKYIVSGYALY